MKPNYAESEPRRPRLDAIAIRSAFVRYRGGDDAAGTELLGLLFSVRNSWARSIQYYKGVSWDLAHDAVLDTILYIHQKARIRRKSRFYLPRHGLRRFIYCLVRRQLWALRRAAKATAEKRRDKKAKSGDAASKYLPRIVHAPEAAAARPAPVFTRDSLEGVALKAFLKFSKRKRAMALAHFEGIPYAEVARMTGTSEKAARVHVSNLVSILRQSVQTTFKERRSKRRQVRHA